MHYALPQFEVNSVDLSNIAVCLSAPPGLASMPQLENNRHLGSVGRKKDAFIL